MLRQVEANNLVPKNWGIVCFLSKQVITIPTTKQIISTLHDHIVYNQPDNTEGLAPCSHEEADTHMMVHVANAAKKYKTVLFCTVDSDVVILAVFVFRQLTNPLWNTFGTGKHFRLLPVYDICVTLGTQKCFALPMFHAFTGCDTVSSFTGKGI